MPRSALERGWDAKKGGLPPEVEIALLTHADFEDIETWVGEPEARVPFDSVGGEPANIDVMVRGSDSDGQCVIAVEAKADESFGATVEDTIASAKRRLRRNHRSGGITRIEGPCSPPLRPIRRRNWFPRPASIPVTHSLCRCPSGSRARLEPAGPLYSFTSSSRRQPGIIYMSRTHSI